MVPGVPCTRPGGCPWWASREPGAAEGVCLGYAPVLGVLESIYPQVAPLASRDHVGRIHADGITAAEVSNR